MKDFLIGCNYWAYNAGADMWRDWDEAQVEKDLMLLKENKLTTIRVFPNWRDFQPIIPVYTCEGVLREYLMEGETEPENPYFLSEVMISRFEKFCDLANKYNIKLIVGLLTGWMSGKLYIPTVLNGKNLFSDSTALRFEHYFIEGFVSRFKDRKEIIAWDLGNECNCMSSADSADTAYSWSRAIANAIKVSDPTRPVISGMHGLGVENGNWTIKDQGRCTDILTTHPYPAFVPHCAKDPIDSIRTLMHATSESLLYSDISKKPCLVEEIGTLGCSICNDNVSALFMRVNLFSNWAHGNGGLLWWCMNEQTHLENPPYRYSMLERGLGLFDENQQPKPFLIEMRKFAEWLEKTDIKLQAPKTDATVLLSRDQDHWGVAYMSFILGKQAGVTLNFVAPNTNIPDSKLYFLPCLHGDIWLYKPYYEQLKEKVANGATVCISNANAFFTQREEFLGTIVDETENMCDGGEFEFNGAVIPYSRSVRQKLTATTAKVLAKDTNGNPLITVNNYGKGKVFYINFLLEETLLSKNRAFDGDTYKVYEYIINQTLDTPRVSKTNKFVGITENGNTITLINYSNAEKETGLKLNGVEIDEILYGDPYKISGCDAAVFTLK